MQLKRQQKLPVSCFSSTSLLLSAQWLYLTWQQVVQGKLQPSSISLAQYLPLVRLNALLNLITFFIAVKSSCLYHYMCSHVIRILTLRNLHCVVAAPESIFSAISAVWTLVLLSVVTASDSAIIKTLGFLLLQLDGPIFLISASCFAIGSAIYSYLFLQARSIPSPLAWLGVIASLLLVVELPLQLMEFLSGLVTQLIWLPMFLFEVTLALWFLIKGINIPAIQ